MEFILVIGMIVAGFALAVLVFFVLAVGRHREFVASSERLGARTHSRESIAASILFEIARAGGASVDEARRVIRDEARIAAPIEEDVDLSSWAQAYGSASDRAQSARLLELAVKTAVLLNPTIPLRQYNALLDLSFGLGFHTDALARLRAHYRFEYIDYAKAGRPRNADRAGGGAPLYQRASIDRAAKLRVLGLDERASREAVISAYRRLASEHHPDRFYDRGEAAQHAAAQRFIEITEAYEALLGTFDSP